MYYCVTKMRLGTHEFIYLFLIFLESSVMKIDHKKLFQVFKNLRLRSTGFLHVHLSLLKVSHIEHLIASLIKFTHIFMQLNHIYSSIREYNPKINHLYVTKDGIFP